MRNTWYDTVLGNPRTQVVVCLIMCVLCVVINQHYSEITIGLVKLTTVNLEKCFEIM